MSAGPASIGPPSATIRYGVTNYRVTMEVSRGEARSGSLRAGPGLIDARWVEPERLDIRPDRKSCS